MKRFRAIFHGPAPLATWAIAVASVWLAVGNQPWGLTILVGAIGALYVFMPPTAAIPRSILVLAGLIVVLATTAFYPASLYNSTFRADFMQHGIVLPWTQSCQPWLTFEDLSLLLATFLWAWACFGVRLTYEERETLSVGFLLFLGGVALNVLMSGRGQGQSLPDWLTQAGIYQNRNQTGDILAMGGILSLVRGLGKLSKHRVAGISWLLLSIIFAAAIVHNGSRAALGLYAVGVVVAYILMPRDRLDVRLIIPILVGVIVIGGAIFLAKGDEMKRRFLVLFAGDEGRWPIYQDALAMLGRIPWNGVGLGNFQGVYNTMREHGVYNPLRCIHPESDWFWIAGELGLVGVLLFALLLVQTFRLYLSDTPYRRLTWASLSVATLFLLHGLIDVGGHRMGTVWPCLYLVSLGASRRSLPQDIRPHRISYWIIGVAFVVLAVLRAYAMQPSPLMPTRASLTAISEELEHAPSYNTQLDLFERGLSWNPLNWLFYYQRGRLQVNNSDTPEICEIDFDRAMYLEQNSIDLPFAIAELCQDRDRPEAMKAWAEVLRRGHKRRVELFNNRFSAVTFEERMKLAKGDPDLEVIAVLRQAPSQFETARTRLFEHNPYLQNVEPDLMASFFDRWQQVGDANGFLEEWPKHPEWHLTGWPAYVKALGQDGRFDEACVLAFKELPPPDTNHIPVFSVLEAERQAALRASDPMVQMELFLAQEKAGQYKQAMDTLTVMGKLHDPPPYLAYLTAHCQYEAGQLEEAWRALLPLLQDVTPKPPAPAAPDAGDDDSTLQNDHGPTPQ